ncbi:MAG TPA: hypothetical protein VHT73_00580 [Thermodesulfobacteriota bacterium]|nr:hypothetical protein [Thermodesulfobacteriota bacterium]
MGTASIIATLNAPPTLVAAGLLHAAYSHGRFSDSRKGITKSKRKKVRLAVGPDIEEFVAQYTALRWNVENILAIREHIDALSTKEREVLLMRIANELEDHLDLGMLYCGKDKSAKLDASVSAIIEIAEKVGGADLANKLALVFSEANSEKIPAILRRSEISSFVLSYTSPFRGYHRFSRAAYYVIDVSQATVAKVTNVFKL